jgi:hypothetical protein
VAKADVDNDDRYVIATSIDSLAVIMLDEIKVHAVVDMGIDVRGAIY